ncbi:MAG: hypothetical protein ABSA21_11010 [Candidatus Limnocylindrales bacterium]|jgi:hypothetical protein
MRSVLRLFVVVATIVALTAIGPSVSAASPRSGDLHVTKECSQYTHLAGGFCTITSSNLPAIEPGSRVYYLQSLVGTVLDTDVVLDPPGPGNNMAFGHVHLNLVTKVGSVTFAGGTGKFTWFTGTVVVTPDSNIPFGWYWDGTYSFSPPAG